MWKITGAILYVIVFVWDLLSDFNKWESGIPIDHTWESFVRMGLLTPSVLLLSGFTLNTIPRKWFIQIIKTIFLLGSCWWLFFDGFYNILRGFGWWFNGSADIDDSFLDKFLMGIKDWQESIIKIGLLITSLFTFFKPTRYEKDQLV